MAPARRAHALPPLLPEPRRGRRLPGQLRLREGVPIVLREGAGDVDLHAARALQAALARRTGLRLPIESHARTRDLGPRIELDREGEDGEAYRLRVDRGAARIEASGGPGLRHGVETLAQLVDARGRIPACRVDDAPRFARRGLMLDVSRGKVPTPAALRELVDVCARLKWNVLVLYIEHVFRFRRHPEIGAGAAPYEPQVLRELDAYAATRHVELVPCLQSLGHMEHVLRLPRYAELAETERRWTLAPAHPGTYRLLGDLYDEFLPNFRSRLFHANCDEPYDLGQGRSRALAEKLGPGGLFLEHVRRVRELAAKHGRRTAIWADFVHAHPERIGELPDDLVLMDWWYEADHDYDRVRRFAERGLAFWVCPGTSAWNTLFPRLPNAFANIERWAEAGRRHGAEGVLLTDWGDFGHYNLQGVSWMPYAWAAQVSWSGPVAARRFDAAFSRSFFGDASGEAARLQRRMGALHDAGFAVFNASPLQFLYFDDLDQARFLRHARPAAVRRTLARLEAVRARLGTAEDRFAGDPLTFAELVHAADASLLALRKALAAHEYLAWREQPGRLDARGRRRLALRLRALADAQTALGRRLRRLWLARSAPEGFELTRRRLQRSIRSLRAAARALERGRPRALPPDPGLSPGVVLRALREGVGLA